MAYAVGTVLALLTALFGRLSRFDRDRAFYPTVLIVIASYYNGSLAVQLATVYSTSFMAVSSRIQGCRLGGQHSAGPTTSSSPSSSHGCCIGESFGPEWPLPPRSGKQEPHGSRCYFPGRMTPASPSWRMSC